MNQAAPINHQEFERSKDYHLVSFVYEAAKANPGLVADRKTEEFLIDQRRFMQDKFEAGQGYWRLSVRQKVWILEIATKQLHLDIPEEYQ